MCNVGAENDSTATVTVTVNTASSPPAFYCQCNHCHVQLCGTNSSIVHLLTYVCSGILGRPAVVGCFARKMLQI